MENTGYHLTYLNTFYTFVSRNWYMEYIKDLNINPNPATKELWEKPILNCLDITETKSGDIDSDSEGSIFFLSWGS